MDIPPWANKLYSITPSWVLRLYIIFWLNISVIVPNLFIYFLLENIYGTHLQNISIIMVKANIVWMILLIPHFVFLLDNFPRKKWENFKIYKMENLKPKGMLIQTSLIIFNSLFLFRLIERAWEKNTFDSTTGILFIICLNLGFLWLGEFSRIAFPQGRGTEVVPKIRTVV